MNEQALQVLVLCGIPASSKSTWAKEWVASDPLNRVRINNDDIRSMCNGSVYSKDYEQLISATRKFLVIQALKSNKSVVIDNLSITKSHWQDTLKWAREANVDVVVSERAFYIDVEEAILRDSKREGTAKVGADVIRKWFKHSGKEGFKNYQPKTETITKRVRCEPPKEVSGDNTVLIVDLDGTLALFDGKRNPYDPTNCDLIDDPNKPLCAIIRSLRDSCCIDAVMFCSGRMEKYRPETMRFINKHSWFNEGWDKLLMRAENDTRSDDIVKEELYRTHIEGKYNVLAVFDDRLRVCKMWHRLGLPLFRFGDPEADF